MTSSAKPEITLEVNSGSFKIPTNDAIYHIIVNAGAEGSVEKLVSHVVRTENGADLVAENGGEEAPGDEFYKEISEEVFNDIGNLARSLSSTMMDIPAEDRREKRVELDEAGEKIESAKSKLKDIMNVTEKATMDILDQVEKVQNQTLEVKDLLSTLKTHPAFAVEAAAADDGADSADDVDGGDSTDSADGDLGGGDWSPSDDLQKAKGVFSSLTALAEEIQADGGEVAAVADAPPVAAAAEVVKRYLFPMDTVFQTLYELCTNETVKTHITNAREKAAEIFDYDDFVGRISTVVQDLEVDDNFMQVPMHELFVAMMAACSDKSVENLLKNMDAKGESIFLDLSLPLEMPEIEESEEAQEQSAPATDDVAAVVPVDQEKAAEISRLSAEGVELLDNLIERSAEISGPPGVSSASQMSMDDQADIFKKIEDAFDQASSISVDTSKITEVLSFQDLSGQQIMKIIKLLTDFQVQLLGLVYSFGSQLKHKEMDRTLSVEESRAMAQEEVDKYLSNLTPPTEHEDDGMLDQDTVNSMLEDMGF